MRAPLTRYRSVVADSARWEGFAFRNGDIVLSAPIKCGITWMQMICALLIFRQQTFPASLDLISPWLDMLTRPLADVVCDLDGQQRRRFVKTHTPLDGLPFDEGVTYVCVGRDPRDVALSYNNHVANMNADAFFAARYMAVGLDDLAELKPVTPPEPPPYTPQFEGGEGGGEGEGGVRERFWAWVEAPAPPGLRSTVHHLATFWEARERPNVVLLHYDDLKADLEGEMRRLAARLGESVPAQSWPELVQAATFAEMRRRADELVPNSTEALWHDNARFFNKGTSGQWRDLLDTVDLCRYQARINELADSKLAAWMHRGPIVR